MASTDSRTKKKTPAAINGACWMSSDAKQLIAQDMIDGFVPRTEKLTKELVDQIYDQLYKGHEYFKNFPYDSERYLARMQSIQVTLTTWIQSAKKDAVSLRKDREKYPAPTHNIRGEPRWNGSEAQRLLKIDMDNGEHEKVSAPRFLWETRDEYKEFSKKAFRKHIDQAKQSRKPYGKTPGQAKKKTPRHRLGGTRYKRPNES